MRKTLYEGSMLFQHRLVIFLFCGWFLSFVIQGKNEDEENDKEDKTKHENNQKFGLLEALLKVGAWGHAEKLLCQLPTYYATAQYGISKQLCKSVKTIKYLMTL